MDLQKLVYLIDTLARFLSTNRLMSFFNDPLLVTYTPKYSISEQYFNTPELNAIVDFVSVCFGFMMRYADLLRLSFNRFSVKNVTTFLDETSSVGTEDDGVVRMNKRVNVS